MKKIFVLSVLFVFMALGVSYGASLTGEVEYLNKEKGMFSVRDQKIEVSFDCDGSMLKDVKDGDAVKVEYSIVDGIAKAASITKVGNEKDREIIGTILSIDKAKGLLVVQNKEIEVGFDCSGTLLSDYKTGDNVIVRYIVEDGREIVQAIEKSAAK
ncbi:secreted protein [Candidatus Magnetoovum chiemensis]|nr:secreted protein [Candidatus Magnetoovum chiemensis]